MAEFIYREYRIADKIYTEQEWMQLPPNTYRNLIEDMSRERLLKYLKSWVADLEAGGNTEPYCQFNTSDELLEYKKNMAAIEKERKERGTPSFQFLK